MLSWSIRPSLAEARRPPNYPYDDMPDTSFTCAGKVVGGYYADPDADCQMFHVCVQVDENDVSTYYQIDLRRYQKKRNGLFCRQIFETFSSATVVETFATGGQ